MRFWTQQMEGKFDEKNVPWKEVRFAHVRITFITMFDNTLRFFLKSNQNK